MLKLKMPLLLFSAVLGFSSVAQDKLMDSLQSALTAQKEDTSRVNTLLLISKTYLGSSPDDAIAYGHKARDLAVKLQFKKGEAYALKNIGIGYYVQAKYIETLDYWQKSKAIFEAINDKTGVANILNNMGAIYSNQADDSKALDYYLQSLKLSEEIGDKLRMSTAMQNIGNIYANKSATYNKALGYLLRALPLSKELNYTDGIVTINTNLGEVNFKMGRVDSALYYYKSALKVSEKNESVSTTFILNNIGEAYAKKGEYALAIRFQQKAIDLAKKLNAKLYVSKSLLGLADTYFQQGNIKSAFDAYKEAEVLAKEVHASYELKDAYEGLALTSAKMGDYANAFTYQGLFANFKDTLYNIEADKKLSSLQFDFDIEKKQGEINLLTKDKKLSEMQLTKEKVLKNALAVGIGLILIIAFVIYRNYRIKAKTNKILDKQKVQIENLLLNILPSDVAQELQATGQATPRHYESVSVLFTDFKGFTLIADKMPPGKLVEELNICFMAFDNIIEKNGLEKIKTIGDSYMCAGGIPRTDETHPYRIVKAGLEIQQYIKENNERRQNLGLEGWDIRIGIHVGPVVAGVVGKKKYAYDIWGSTVNIASRMESNGYPGQVNISSTTYELVKDKFACKHRGKIYAKNVGEIDMYFVEGEFKFPFDAETEKAHEPGEQELAPI